MPKNLFKQARCHRVLFVIGMGNNGARDLIRTCPTGISPYHPNALTVAGTDSNGFLSRYSNYCKDIAMIAAPFEVDTVKLSPSSMPHNIAVAPQAGTSMSTAWVSNAALRLIARHPELSLPQLISILMKACDKSNIDVACGGKIDFDKLEGI